MVNKDFPQDLWTWRLGSGLRAVHTPYLLVMAGHLSFSPVLLEVQALEAGRVFPAYSRLHFT